MRTREGTVISIYIGFLRGVNVGGKTKISMPELKRMLETMGLSRAQTYIQSGNVLFESAEAPELLRRQVEQEIVTAFGMSVTVMLRTAGELEQIIANCPYASDSLSAGESIQVSMLTEAPAQADIARLANGKSPMDEFQVNGREIYFLLRQSVIDSKLMPNLQKLGQAVTTRNWNTIVKLAALARAMQG